MGLLQMTYGPQLLAAFSDFLGTTANAGVHLVVFLARVVGLTALPLGIALVLRMIPAPVMAAARARAALHDARPRNWVAAALIVLLWIGLALLAARAAWRILGG